RMCSLAVWQESVCQKVRAELEEVKKVRAGFADARLLEAAERKGLSGQQYNDMVAEALFGKPKGGQAAYVNPMFTDPTRCRIEERWNRAEYQRQGVPEIIYRADRAHEEVHKESCLKVGGDRSTQYLADMSFPRKLSQDEIKAY